MFDIAYGIKNFFSCIKSTLTTKQLFIIAKNITINHRTRHVNIVYHQIRINQPSIRKPKPAA